MNIINPSIVYLGIDVHKRTYAVTAVSENTRIKRVSMPADPNILLAFIHNYFSKATVYSAYEAGFSGFGLHRFLVNNGIKNIVVHPASIEVASKNKVKNDKRDSEKIAFQLSHGKLHCVHVPSPQREFWRTITRLRSQYVKERARCACRIKSFLFYFSLLPHSHKGRTSCKWIKSLLTLQNINEDVLYCIQSYVQTWLYFNEKIKTIDKRLQEQAKKDYTVNNVYKKSNGIGLIASRILANELGDMSQFNSESALYSFTGLTPCEYSSGDHRRLGNISRQGNPIVRGILTEAAWKAIKKNPMLEIVFDRLVRNTGSRKKAILGVARRMIGHTRAEFKKKNTYKKENLCIR